MSKKWFSRVAHASGLGDEHDEIEHRLKVEQYRLLSSSIEDDDRAWWEKCLELQDLMNLDLKEKGILTLSTLMGETDARYVAECAVSALKTASDTAECLNGMTGDMREGASVIIKKSRNSADKTMAMVKKSGGGMLNAGIAALGFDVAMSRSTPRAKLDIYKRLMDSLIARHQTNARTKDETYTAYSYTLAALALLESGIEGNTPADNAREISYWGALQSNYETSSHLRGGKTRKNKKKRRYTR